VEYAFLAILIVLTLLAATIFLVLRWWRGKIVASLLFAELNEIVETSVTRDYVGALYVYQSHLAAGHRMRVPAILGFETIGTPVFHSSLSRLSVLGPDRASEVVEFYAGLQRMRHDLRSIIGDDVSPPESVAEWLGEDIRLSGELEVRGALLLTRLEAIAQASFLAFAKKSISAVSL
jgi:hypothetical protein